MTCRPPRMLPGPPCRLRRRGVWLAALVGLFVLAAPSEADSGAGVAVEGADSARLLPPGGANVTAYENAGYRLLLEGGEALVEVRAAPLYSRSVWQPPTGEPAGTVERLARSQTLGAKTHYEASSRILGWVSRQIEYRLEREMPQSAEAVLERRSGFCTGIARLTVALLRGAGLEAREVAGYVLGDEGFGEAQGYHRWVEVRLPDVGWVFSDPLSSHHYVPATYVRLESELLHLDRGTRGLLIERHDTVAPVDLYPAAPPGIRARRNHERQLAASLRVAVDVPRGGMAVLETSSRRWRHALVSGETTFVGLPPGEYHLRLMTEGTLLERRFEVVGRQRKTLYLEAPARLSRPGPASAPRAAPLAPALPGDAVAP